MQARSRSLLGALAVMLFSAGSMRAASVRVPEDCPTIQCAVDACGQGDTVSVGPGTYRGAGNRDVRIVGKDLVLIGIAGPDMTTIDCEQAGRFLSIESSFGTVLDGFTVVNGYSNHFGGAIDADGVSLANCVFIANTSTMGGGAVCTSADAPVRNCTFLGNIDLGGHGGALWQMMVFFGDAVFENCLFAGNYSAWYGGALSLNNTQGGLFTIPLLNCTFNGNQAELGGAIDCLDAPIHLDRTICRGNCASGRGDEVFADQGGVTVDCSDVNRSGFYGLDINYGQGVIDVDPIFCDPRPCGITTDGNYHLRSDSPCLPANSPCGELIGALGLGCAGPATGACCLPDGFCVIEEQQQCADQHGIYMGDGSACVPDPCHSTPTKATTWGAIKSSFR
jgi:hypothetical protein